MIRSVEETATGSTADRSQPMAFTFPHPAPADAYLRVSAYGEGYQYSIDSGATWL